MPKSSILHGRTATGLDATKSQPLELSLSQREVWLDQMAWPGSAHLNIGGGAFLRGRLDLALLKASLHLLVQESQALRLVPDATTSQRLLAQVEPLLEWVDLSASVAPVDDMRSWWLARFRQPWVWAGRLPWRFTLLRAHDELHGLTLQFHHLVMDGWGTSLVMRRWSRIYNTLAAGQTHQAQEGASYQDFIAASLQYRESPAFAQDKAFWRKSLPQLPAPLLGNREFDTAAAGMPGMRGHSTTVLKPRRFSNTTLCSERSRRVPMATTSGRWWLD